jgi:hypothetical protein
MIRVTRILLDEKLNSRLSYRTLLLARRDADPTGIRLELRSALPAGLPLQAVPGLLPLATQRNWTAARLGVTLRDQ